MISGTFTFTPSLGTLHKQQSLPKYLPSDVNPGVFTLHTDMDAIKQSVNSSITGTASNRSTTGPMATFCRKLWDAMDDAVGGLEEITAVLSFSPDALEIDDPFREDRGCMYHVFTRLFLVDGRSTTSFGARN